MGALEFFNRNKKSGNESVKTRKPSVEQIRFADAVLTTMNPTLEKFGFVRHRTEVTTYSSTIVWRKDNRYVKISSTSAPRDYPPCYNIILGEGDSDSFFEYDWNSVALWRLKARIVPAEKSAEYMFPLGDAVYSSISYAHEELLNYANAFLQGELSLFYNVRSEQNKHRDAL